VCLRQRRARFRAPDDPAPWPTTRLGGVNARRSLAAAVLALAIPSLTSCGVNFSAQTDAPYNPSAGVDDRSGRVDVLNALVVSGSKGSGTVIATLVNNDQLRADSLSGISGAGSDSSLQVTPGGKKTIPAGGLLNLATDGSNFVRGARVVPGNFVDLTFSFKRAGSVTIQVPVLNANGSTIYSGVKLPSGG
jgi:hypothetical protein